MSIMGGFLLGYQVGFVTVDQGNTKTMSPTPLSDTQPEAERVLLELMRKAPSWRKAHMLGQMYHTMKQLTLSGLRQRHPQASEAELRRRLADLLLGPELAEKVYGPMPVEEPPNAH